MFSLMNTMLTGLILAAVVLGGLAYVIVGLKRGGEATALGVNSADAIGGDMVVVRSGDEPEAEAETDLEVSTPLLRNAVRHEVARSRLTWMRFRRLGLVVAVALALAIVMAPLFFPSLPGGVVVTALIPLVAWVLWARTTLVRKNRQFKRRLASLDQGWDEQTQLITVADVAKVKPAESPEISERSIELSVPIPGLKTLLEPMPVAPVTYVSRPVLPRSVRTVDLSAPRPVSDSPDFPVSADYPQDVLPFESPDVNRRLRGRAPEVSDELPRAVGE